MPVNDKFTPTEQSLIDQGYLLIKEHHMFGHYPLFKNYETNEVRYVGRTEAGEKILTKEEMYNDLYTNWRPAAQEERDWFCTSMKRYFGIE